MNVHRAEARHVPHHFRQHSEGHNHLQIGGVGFELGLKFGCFQVGRLQHGQAVGQGPLPSPPRLAVAARAPLAGQEP